MVTRFPFPKQKLNGMFEKETEEKKKNNEGEGEKRVKCGP